MLPCIVLQRARTRYLGGGFWFRSIPRDGRDDATGAHHTSGDMYTCTSGRFSRVAKTTLHPLHGAMDILRRASFACLLCVVAVASDPHVSPYSPHSSASTPWFEGWYIRVQGQAGSAAFGIGTTRGRCLQSPLRARTLLAMTQDTIQTRQQGNHAQHASSCTWSRTQPRQSRNTCTCSTT
jgi:hypothetical protein